MLDLDLIAQSLATFWAPYTTIIGTVAATLTTICFLPQVVHILRTRDTKAISLGMYAMFTVGMAMWLTYGIFLNSWPMIVADSVTVALASVILVMKLRLG